KKQKVRKRDSELIDFTAKLTVHIYTVNINF
ncbi:MAG: hypothetical protein ACI9Y1_002644, partial [Lentisphaeria bacterium]